jgi:hypothetical protein
MSTSSVFIELMLHAIYDPLNKHAKIVFGKKSSIVLTVKLFSTFFDYFDAFLFSTFNQR